MAARTKGAAELEVRESEKYHLYFRNVIPCTVTYQLPEATLKIKSKVCTCKNPYVKGNSLKKPRCKHCGFELNPNYGLSIRKL